MDKPRLFHSIGPDGAESSAVRKFIVDHDIQGDIEFSNIAYEGPQQALLERIGKVEAPVLFNGPQTYRGREAIIAWLQTNLISKVSG